MRDARFSLSVAPITADATHRWDMVWAQNGLALFCSSVVAITTFRTEAHVLKIERVALE